MLDMLMCVFLAQMWSKQNKQTLLCEICYTYTYMNVCGEGKGGCKSPRYITLVHYYFCILSNVIFKGFFFCQLGQHQQPINLFLFVCPVQNRAAPTFPGSTRPKQQSPALTLSAPHGHVACCPSHTVCCSCLSASSEVSLLCRQQQHAICWGHQHTQAVSLQCYQTV